MLPESINLVGAAGNETFESPKRTSTGQTYVSDSPQGDIQGAPSLRVETSKTAKQIERGVIQMQRPLWDAAKGQYVFFTTINLQANRHVSVSVADVLDYLKKICSMPEEVLEAFAKGQL
jgi:hypothetical protein